MKEKLEVFSGKRSDKLKKKCYVYFVWLVKLVKESIVSKIKTCLFDYLLPKYCFVNHF